MEQEEKRLLEISDEQREKIAELKKEVNITKAGNNALAKLAEKQTERIEDLEAELAERNKEIKR